MFADKSLKSNKKAKQKSAANMDVKYKPYFLRSVQRVMAPPNTYLTSVAQSKDSGELSFRFLDRQSSNISLGKLEKVSHSCIQRVAIQVSDDEEIDTQKFTGSELNEMMSKLAGARGNHWAAQAVFKIFDAISKRDFKGGMTAGGYLEMLIATKGDDTMTGDIIRELSGLLKHPNSKLEAITSADLLQLFNYPLVNGVKRAEYNVLRWVLGVYKRTPHAGKFGDVTMDENGQINGRPQFPSYTQKMLENDPTQARRHIVAWHNIRNMMNLLINNIGGLEKASSVLKKLKIIAPKQVTEEAERLLGLVPPKALGGDESSRKDIFRILFIMNGNPANLWLGNSIINSQLPGIFSRTIETIKKTKTLKELVALAENWKDEEESDSIDETAHRAVALAMLDFWNIAKDMPEASVNPKGVMEGMLRKAQLALTVLEVDLVPGSQEEKENLNAPQHSVIASLGKLIHGEDFNLQHVLSLFQELLAYPSD